MPKYGVKFKVNVAVLLIGITTFIPSILSFDNYNLQHQRYDYIDVAKATAGSRSKGQTTRIFTTDDELDEKFWLKYLGEDFRHAVHLQVDGQNNVIPVNDVKPPTLPTLKYYPKAKKPTRFVREPTQEENDKPLSVESLEAQNDNENQYPTEEPETFNVYLTTTTTPTTTTNPLPSANKKQYSAKTQQYDSNKNTSKHKDNLLLYNKNNKQKVAKVRKPCRIRKVVNEPIVVHLPETDDDAVQHINEQNIPGPPLIFQQRAELYPENKSYHKLFVHNNQLFAEQIPNLNLNNQNMEYYSQPLPLNRQQYNPRHSTDYTTHSQQTHFTTIHNSRSQHNKQQQQHHFLIPTQYITHKHLK